MTSKLHKFTNQIKNNQRMISFSSQEILVQGGGVWLQRSCCSCCTGQWVYKGGVSTDGESWSGCVPTTHDSWLRSMSLNLATCFSPNMHAGGQCRPGGHSRTCPLIPQKTLLTPGHGSGRIWRRGVRRAPIWVLGENGKDLRSGEFWLWRLWK